MVGNYWKTVRDVFLINQLTLKGQPEGELSMLVKVFCGWQSKIKIEIGLQWLDWVCQTRVTGRITSPGSLANMALSHTSGLLEE
jgi:hypothetical protein